jgi:hypothetical protein
LAGSCVRAVDCALYCAICGTQSTYSFSHRAMDTEEHFTIVAVKCSLRGVAVGAHHCWRFLRRLELQLFEPLSEHCVRSGCSSNTLGALVWAFETAIGKRERRATGLAHGVRAGEHDGR